MFANPRDTSPAICRFVPRAGVEQGGGTDLRRFERVGLAATRSTLQNVVVTLGCYRIAVRPISGKSVRFSLIHGTKESDHQPGKVAVP